MIHSKLYKTLTIGFATLIFSACGGGENSEEKDGEGDNGSDNGGEEKKEGDQKQASEKGGGGDSEKLELTAKEFKETRVSARENADKSALMSGDFKIDEYEGKTLVLTGKVVKKGKYKEDRLSDKEGKPCIYLSNPMKGAGCVLKNGDRFEEIDKNMKVKVEGQYKKDRILEKCEVEVLEE